MKNEVGVDVIKDVKFLKAHASKTDKTFISIEKRFDAVDKRFDAVDKRFDRVESQIDSLALHIYKNTDDIAWLKDNMATKDDIRGITDTLDVMLKILTKNEQEVTFMGERVSRNTNDIITIKPLVGLA